LLSGKIKGRSRTLARRKKENPDFSGNGEARSKSGGEAGFGQRGLSWLPSLTKRVPGKKPQLGKKKIRIRGEGELGEKTQRGGPEGSLGEHNGDKTDVRQKIPQNIPAENWVSMQEQK